jgi:hypothetical protein
LETVGKIFSVQVTGVGVVLTLKIPVPFGSVSVTDIILELLFEAASELINQIIADRCTTSGLEEVFEPGLIHQDFDGFLNFPIPGFPEHEALVPVLPVFLSLMFEEAFSVFNCFEERVDSVLVFLGMVEDSVFTAPVILRPAPTIRHHFMLLFRLFDCLPVMSVRKVILQFVPKFTGENGTTG